MKLLTRWEKKMWWWKILDWDDKSLWAVEKLLRKWVKKIYWTLWKVEKIQKCRKYPKNVKNANFIPKIFFFSVFFALKSIFFYIFFNFLRNFIYKFLENKFLLNFCSSSIFFKYFNFFPVNLNFILLIT